jgi:cytochrome c peroxidase
LDINWPSDTAKICASPNVGGSATQVQLSPEDRTRSNTDYDHWAQPLSAYEHSLSVSPFTSKFDAFLAGKYQMTPDEQAGTNCFVARGIATHATWTADQLPLQQLLRAARTPGPQPM